MNGTTSTIAPTITLFVPGRDVNVVTRKAGSLLRQVTGQVERLARQYNATSVPIHDYDDLAAGFATGFGVVRETDGPSVLVYVVNGTVADKGAADALLSQLDLTTFVLLVADNNPPVDREWLNYLKWRHSMSVTHIGVVYATKEDMSIVVQEIKDEIDDFLGRIVSAKKPRKFVVE
jgi:hypothetical protein